MFIDLLLNAMCDLVQISGEGNSQAGYSVLANSFLMLSFCSPIDISAT
jgi:hypothetical protein